MLLSHTLSLILRGFSHTLLWIWTSCHLHCISLVSFLYRWILCAMAMPHIYCKIFSPVLSCSLPFQQSRHNPSGISGCVEGSEEEECLEVQMCPYCLSVRSFVFTYNVLLTTESLSILCITLKGWGFSFRKIDIYIL